MFSLRVDEANEKIEKKPDELVGRECPKCGSELVYKVSRYGEKFIACSGFPKCKYSESLVPKVIEYTGESCPKCGNPLVFRTSKRTKSKFIGCSAFPKCKHTQEIAKKVDENKTQID